MHTQAFGEERVAAVFAAFPDDVRPLLFEVRAMIFATASGTLVETLKWGQAAYLPATARTGTTVRLDALMREPGRYAIFVNCKTDIVERCRSLYPDAFEYRGNRALVLDTALPQPREPIAHALDMALNYYRKNG